jgi:chromosome segregation ATPase
MTATIEQLQLNLKELTEERRNLESVNKEQSSKIVALGLEVDGLLLTKTNHEGTIESMKGEADNAKENEVVLNQTIKDLEGKLASQIATTLAREQDIEMLTIEKSNLTWAKKELNAFNEELTNRKQALEAKEEQQTLKIIDLNSQISTLSDKISLQANYINELTRNVIHIPPSLGSARVSQCLA